MAKRTRAPVRRGRATQATQNPRKTASKTVRKTTLKTASEPAEQTGLANLSRCRVYAPELLAYARQRFEQTEDTVADIAVDLGVHENTLRKVARRESWIRYVRQPKTLPPAIKLLAEVEALDLHPEVPDHGEGDSALPASAGGEGTIPPLADTIARLHRVVLDELAALESLRAQLNRAPRGFAGTARTLSILTETLQKLQRLQPGPANTGPDDADIPADIDEFRNELARRIDAFVMQRTDAGDGDGLVAPAMDAAV
jgi:hypothetical protein